MHLFQDELVRARQFLEESVAILKEIGDQAGTAESLSYLARVTARQGDLAAARALYEESWALLSELENKLLAAASLEGLGEVVAAQESQGVPSSSGEQQQYSAPPLELPYHRSIALPMYRPWP